MECGNRKKSDVLVMMKRNSETKNLITIQSKYDGLFIENIKEVVNNFIEKNSLSGYDITVEDFGAWDYTLQARLEACLFEMEGEK